CARLFESAEGFARPIRARRHVRFIKPWIKSNRLQSIVIAIDDRLIHALVAEEYSDLLRTWYSAQRHGLYGSSLWSSEIGRVANPVCQVIDKRTHNHSLKVGHPFILFML